MKIELVTDESIKISDCLEVLKKTRSLIRANQDVDYPEAVISRDLAMELAAMVVKLMRRVEELERASESR